MGNSDTSDIVIFDQADQPIEVRLEAETVWQTQAQMVELFGKNQAEHKLACLQHLQGG